MPLIPEQTLLPLFSRTVQIPQGDGSVLVKAWASGGLAYPEVAWPAGGLSADTHLITVGSESLLSGSWSSPASESFRSGGCPDHSGSTGGSAGAGGGSPKPDSLEDLCLISTGTAKPGR